MIVMFLINAIYFKGTWTYEFDQEETKDDEFTLLDGSKVPCRMMEQEADLLYMSNDLFQIVDLPYGDKLFSMTVILPSPGVTVDSVVALLTPGNWAEWMSGLETMGIRLQLPKLKLEYGLEMKNVLKSLGMGIAFNEPLGVDFSRMIEPPGLVWIDKVKHKTFVQVDEEGTEAAAATVVVMVYESAGGGDPLLVRVDRPFIFVIREDQSLE
ncbi:serpin family protein, partial [Candidatus Neomarinimicrobiota bacterium]